MNTKSRNQREGHFAGKFLRRYRRRTYATPHERYWVEAATESDWTCTRAERRADSLLQSQIRRGVRKQDPYDEERPF